MTSLVRVFKDASKSDLDAIDKEIAETEKQRTALDGELRALRMVRRMIDTKVNGPKQRAPRSPKATHGQGRKSTASAESDHATQIYDLIAQEGSMPVAAIAARLKIHHLTVGKIVTSHSWFVPKNGEVSIAKTKGA